MSIYEKALKIACSITQTHLKTRSIEIFLDVHLCKKTEPQDKSIFYVRIFQQKARSVLLFVGWFGDEKIANVHVELALKLHYQVMY